MDLKDIELHIFRLPLSLSESKRFEKVYDFWHRSWKDVFKEIGKGDSGLTSDDLTRQHEIMVMFLKDRPIAMVCHRYVDLSSASVYRDSYFDTAWTEKDKFQLRRMGGWACIGNQIVVDPEFRKANCGLKLKHLISFVSLQAVQRWNVDVVIGTMRADRGMHSVFYQAGAETLSQNVPYHGASVDLVCFRPKLKPIVIPKEFQDAVTDMLSRAKESSATEPELKIKRAA